MVRVNRVPSSTMSSVYDVGDLKSKTWDSRYILRAFNCGALPSLFRSRGENALPRGGDCSHLVDRWVPYNRGKMYVGCGESVSSTKIFRPAPLKHSSCLYQCVESMHPFIRLFASMSAGVNAGEK